MQAPAEIPTELKTFLSVLTTAMTSAIGERLVGIYLHGSAGLGALTPGRSDLDLMIVVDGPLDTATKSRVVRGLWNLTPPAVIRGVETGVVVADDLRLVETMTRSELYVSTHPGEPETRDASIDPVQLIELDIIRNQSVTLVGPPAEEIVGAISRRDVLEAMLATERDGDADLPESYRVLTGARQMLFTMMGEHVSKMAAAEWAIEQGYSADLLQRAIDVQLGVKRDRPLSSKGRRFLSHVVGTLQAGIAEEAD